MKNIVSLIILMVSCLPLAAAPRKSASPAPAAPDFAFPQTVAADARRSMDKAMSAGRYVDALASAMQLCIADNLIDKANTQTAIATVDSLARLMPADEAALALMIEAQIYADYYASERYKFDRRTLPLTSYPEEIADWSRGLFARKVGELVRQSLDKVSGNGLKLSGMAPVLTSTSAATYVPDEYNFLHYKAVDLISRLNDSGSSAVIPFRAAGESTVNQADKDKTVSSGLTSAQLMEQLMAHNSNYEFKAPLAYSMCMRAGMLDGKTRQSFLEKSLRELGDVPESVMLLAAYAEGAGFGSFKSSDDYIPLLERASEFCVKADEALQKWPGAMGASSLRNSLAELRQPGVKVRYESQYLSTVPFRPSVTMCNTSEAWMLLYNLPVTLRSRQSKVSEIISGRKPVGSVRINAGSIAESGLSRLDTVVDFGALGYGRYLAVPSLTATAAGIPKSVASDYADLFIVSDMRTFTASASGASQVRRVYVVDGASGRPLKGVKVELLEYVKGSLKPAHTIFTDSDGAAEAPSGNWTMRVSNGKDILPGDAYLYTYGEQPKRKMKAASILTDLSVYHPGDSVGFAVVAYSIEGRQRKTLPSQPLTVNLRDVNNTIVATSQLTTDGFGRASAYLDIPSSGLLGSWSLEAVSGSDNIGWQYFEVADYKAPTFFVEVDSVEVNPLTRAHHGAPLQDSIPAGEVTVRGKVMTYSGMPVAGAEIDFDIRYVSYWWWRGNESPDAVYSGKSTTDEAGNFELRLSTDGLKDTPYSFGTYRLNVSATSPAGEMQQAPPASFALGSTYRIVPEIPGIVEAASKENCFDVKVLDMLGFPARKQVNYTLLPRDGSKADSRPALLSGSFTSPSLAIDLSKLASGAYTLRFTIEGADSTATATADFTLYRRTDKVPPVKTHLWTPVKQITAARGQKEVEVTVGTSYPDGYILCYTTDSEGAVSAHWLKVNASNASVKVPVPADGQAKWLSFVSVDSLLTYTAQVKIEPCSAVDRLKIATETFRDKIVPGERERWTFRVTYADKVLGQLPMMAVLSDKALNAIQPFHWNFSLRGNDGLYNPLSINSYNPGARFSQFRLSTLRSVKEAIIEQPDWMTYGYSFVPYGYRKLRIRGSKMYKSADVVSSDEVVNEVFTTAAPMMAAGSVNDAVYATLKEEAAVESRADEGTEQSSEKDTPLREMAQPLGFFMPSLITDDAGTGVIEFVVPDFNTTWQLQLASYTPDLKTAVSTLETTAQKPVMVRCNAPRFLRTSDKAYISATLYNATSDSLPIAGQIDVIEPMSGDVVASLTTSRRMVPASGSYTFSEHFTVPDSIRYLLVRVYARSATHSDGEQTLVSILPSSTPVIESTAFYLTPGQDSFSVNLPDFNDGSRLTLQYCDNPVWYCVTALPSISVPESKSLLSLLRAYYAGAMAQGLVGRYPAIRTGLERILADAPQSPLSMNADLKTVELMNTPWVNNASSETARMRSLSHLIGTEAKPSLDRLASDILALQNSDGGWSWCRGMRSSAFMTGRVLLHFGMLRQCGYLAAAKRIEGALASGCKYFDSEQLASYQRNRNKISAAEAVDWLYIRSFYPKRSESPAVKAMHTKAVEKIRKDWRSLSLSDKARAAIVLNGEGYAPVAATILESLRQYAVYTPQAGMRYENLPSGYNGVAPLAATAQVLEAFARVQPKSESIDRLRQGLILQRQAQDWGADPYTVEVINAILTSGSDWTVAASAPQITLAGRQVALPASSNPVGYYRVDIPLAGASGASLDVSRTGSGPAWGSVISQYVAPVADVKAAAMPEISISKAIYKVIDMPGETVAADTLLKVGDKVRVTLTVTTSRDMDYVAITDARPACLEPLDQLSAYTCIDGLWLYRETRDASTNFFISHLSKGSHVITYDCYVDREGKYTIGIASAQSQYAPQITAHSAGQAISIK